MVTGGYPKEDDYPDTKVSLIGKREMEQRAEEQGAENRNQGALSMEQGVGSRKQ